MRVLVHLKALEPLGGVEQCVLEDATSLVRRGHDVHVAYGADGSARPAYEALGARLGGPFGFELDKRHPLRMARDYLPAARWAVRERVDVVWLQRFEHVFWGQAVARYARRPLVATLHEVPMFNRVRLLGTGVAHYTAVSEHVRQAWVRQGLPAERVTTVANAVSPDDYPFTGPAERAARRAELGLPQDVPVVLCYGRTVEGKGVGDLCEAWQLYRTQRLEAGLPVGVLVLLGDPHPSHDPEVAKRFAALDPAEVRWLPATRDVRPHLQACDVVVFPTRLDEAFGRVVIEAMSSGRPCLATRSGAVPELLEGGFEDHLVPARDPAALAAGLARLVTGAGADPSLGARCRDWVEQRFPYSRHEDEVERVLLEAAGRGRRVRDA